VGCGNHCAVSGKVSFPDGTPLSVGEVAFETGTFFATGAIKSDGTYTMGTPSKPGGGIPRGTYRVSLQGVIKPTVEFVPGSHVPKITPPKEFPIDQKFTSTSTSGLTCEVKGRTKYDITVEPPVK